jgi:hypothetical protein
MKPKIVNLLRLRALWVWAGCVAALGLAAACSDVTVPRYTPGNDSTEQDTSSTNQGLAVPLDSGRILLG